MRFNYNGVKKIFVLCLLFLLVFSANAYAVAVDDNFDDLTSGSTGLKSYTSPRGMIYTFNDSGAGEIYLDGVIVYMASNAAAGSATEASFKTADGSEFKLNSFRIKMGFGNGADISISGYRDGALIVTSPFDISSTVYETFNVSGNNDWGNIDEVKITGSSLDIEIDDLDVDSAVVAATYTVTYDDNGKTGGSVPDDVNAYSNGATVTVLGNTGTLVKTNYTFSGWTMASDGSGTVYTSTDSFAMGTSAVTLYAKWTEDAKYSVTYNGNGETGGSEPATASYYAGSSVSVSANTGTLVKTNYTFAGWTMASDGSGTVYTSTDSFVMGTSAVTLYAKWTEDAKYGVTYNGNGHTGGSEPVTASYYAGTSVSVSANTGTLVKTNYTFAGWTMASDGSGTLYTSTDLFVMGTSAVTLYAKWTEDAKYGVTYNGNGHTGGSEPATASYYAGSSVSVSDNTGTLVKTNYTFTGWTMASDGSGTVYTSTDSFAMGASAVTLYAKWTEDAKYGVTYNGNGHTGGSEPATASYYAGSSVSVSANTGTLAKTNYTFAGWTMASDGSGTVYTSTDSFAMGTSAVTLYAKWTEDAKYSVTYNGNGETSGSEPATASYYEGSSVSVSANTGTLVKTNYTFAGWTMASDGSGTVYTSTDSFAMGTSAVTLYAKWTEDAKYSVTYNGNGHTGGSVPATTSYYAGSNVSVSDNTGTLVKTNYTFTGWTMASDGSGTVYTSTNSFAMGTSAVTLYAKWTEDAKYSVTYNGNGETGGSEPATASYYAGSSVSVSDNTGTLVKTNYTFTGWTMASDGSGTVYTSTDSFAMGASAVTLYAKWTEDAKYGVTYNGNGHTGGSEPATASYYAGSSVSVSANTGTLAKTNYTFAGWTMASDGSGTVYTSTDSFAMGASAVTLYAKWTAETTAPSLTAGVVTRTSDTVGTVKFTSNEAGSYYYAVVADGAAEPVIDTTGAGIACTTAETTITNPIGLTAGAKDIYIKVKDAAGNVSTALKIDIAAYTSSSGGSSSGSGDSTTTTQPSQGTVVVIVNGNAQNAGKETTSTESGKSTVTIEVENKVIESKIDEAIKNNTTGTDNVIQVPIADTKSEVAKVELTGDIVKKLEENTFDVSVKRDNVEYVIPAEEFAISRVAENLGVLEKNLGDIKIEVRITKLDETVVAKYNEVAKANGAELVFPPISFEVVAKTTKTDGTTGRVEISKFSNYVERVMEIPDNVDPSKITTGIVFNADGTYSHVPTDIFQKDGKWYASLNSLTNSNYSVIWNPITVQSVENHWSKDAVNDMASRLIIFNPEAFAPDKAITRADFAEYIVRALGIYREGSIHENNFKDVSATGARTLAILIANEYGIVSGYSDGTFRGDNQITREEAMAMYQRAMKITKLTGTDKERYQTYTDYAKVSGWATIYVKDVLASHVFNGTTATTISPKANLTYAEAAQAIKNLLVEAKLINN